MTIYDCQSSESGPDLRFLKLAVISFGFRFRLHIAHRSKLVDEISISEAHYLRFGLRFRLHRSAKPRDLTSYTIFRSLGYNSLRFAHRQNTCMKNQEYQLLVFQCANCHYDYYLSPFKLLYYLFKS